MLASAVRRGLQDAAAGRRPAVRLLRGLRRAGGRDGAAVHQGGGLRRRQARARRHQRAARPGDRRRRDPGHGPRRADAADGDRARRLPGAGPDRQTARCRSPATRSRCRRPGCFSIVFEAIPAAVSEVLMTRLEIPVIGIGAGPATDGQVLVFHDLLGDLRRPRARGSPSATGSSGRRWSRASPSTRPRCARGAFPGPEHTYSIDER